MTSDNLPTPTHAPATAGPPTALVDELRQLIGLRSRQTLRDRPFPQLFALLSEADLATPDSRFTALTRLLDAASATIDDPAHRHAATALVGSGPGRWRTVTQRGTDAAAVFGCGWDAYRRKRTSGTSQLDDTLDALACALRQVGGAPAPDAGPGAPLAPITDASPPRTGPADPPSASGSETTTTRATPTPRPAPIVAVAPVVLGPTATGPTHTRSTSPATGEPDEAPRGPRPRPRRRRDAVTLVLVGLALVAGALVAWAVSRPDGATTGVGTAGRGAVEAESDRPASCARLTHRPGDLDPAADAELRAWAPVFRSAAADLPAGEETCAGLLTHEIGLVVQPISDGTPQGVGALVAVDDEPRRTVMLHHSEYWIYRNHVLSFGSSLGAPRARADRSDGTWVVKLDQGTIVGGPHEQARLVSGAAFALWVERGGMDGEMGLPVSAQRDVPGVGKVQDFQHGRVVIDYLDPLDVRWQAVPNPAGLLRPQIEDRVLVADDGTSWWIDGDGVRHWLPTQNDYGCATALVGGADTDVPIIAIATLEIGEPSRCR